MNNIINLLNLENKNIEISKIERDYNAKIKYIHVLNIVRARLFNAYAYCRWGRNEPKFWYKHGYT